MFNIGTDSTVRLQKKVSAGFVWLRFTLAVICVFLQSQFWLGRGLKQPQPGLVV